MTPLTGTFSLPLELGVSPEDLWPLFAELPLRRRWIRMPGPSATATHEFDFRPGGSEVLTNTFISGDHRESLENRSQIYDVVERKSIVWSYQAIVDGSIRWVSLATVRLDATDAGTRLEWTEQYAFLQLSSVDGGDDVKHLIGGTRLRLNGLVAVAAELPGS